MPEFPKEIQPVAAEAEDEITAEEIAAAVRTVRKTKKGHMPRDLFYAIAEKMASPIVEMVPIRRNAQGEIEILLTRRPPDDPYWPDMLHVPGTLVRSDDTNELNADALARVRQGELEGVELGEPVKVYELTHDSERGKERSDVYCVEVFGEPGAGAFYPFSALPDDLVPSQLDFIPIAVHNYNSAQAQQI